MSSCPQPACCQERHDQAHDGADDEYDEEVGIGKTARGRDERGAEFEDGAHFRLSSAEQPVRGEKTNDVEHRAGDGSAADDAGIHFGAEIVFAAGTR